MRTEEIDELSLAQILTGHYLQAKLPSTLIRGVHESLIMKHNQAQRTDEWLYESNIATIIEIIELSFPGQIRNHLSSNHYMSEKSPFCSTS